jgi:copper chaperone
MLTYEVKDMTCAHCASTITRAVKAVDATARVEIELNLQRVTVESSTADDEELSQAIKEAGYTPVAVQPEALATKPAKAGGCCGGCR